MWVCIDTDGDGIRRCTDVSGGACPVGQLCVNTDGDEDAHCRGPAPERITIPPGFDGLIGAPEAGEFRLRGRVVHPTVMAAGSHPLVLIAHGRHTPLHVRFPGERWGVFDPAWVSNHNYRGHADLQQHLASYGIISASIDLDEAVGFTDDVIPMSMGYPWVPNGILMRGWVTLKNLEHVLALPMIAGNVDPTQIHLLGHSRGGEGVLAAWHVRGDVAARGPASVAAGPDTSLAAFAIASVISVAPTSIINVAPPTGTTPFFLLYGATDGDVNGWTSNIVMPLRHLDRAEGFRACVIVGRANHNFFNSSWPSDDFAGGVPPRVTRAEQEQILRVYVLAWLRAMRGDPGARAMFETPVTRLRPLGTGAVQLWTQTRPESAFRLVIDDHEINFGDPRLSSSGAAVTLAGVTVIDEPELFDPDPADESSVPNRFAGETRGVLLEWSAPSTMAFDVPAAGTDFRTFGSLSVRGAPEPLGGAAPTMFAIKLTDGAGVDSTAIPTDFATALPPTFFKDNPVLGGDLTNAFFQAVKIDVDRFTVGAPSFNLGDVRRVTFVFGTPYTPSGRIVLDDLELER
jgi:hypothetical protein